MNQLDYISIEFNLESYGDKIKNVKDHEIEPILKELPYLSHLIEDDEILIKTNVNDFQSLLVKIIRNHNLPPQIDYSKIGKFSITK